MPQEPRGGRHPGMAARAGDSEQIHGCSCGGRARVREEVTKSEVGGRRARIGASGKERDAHRVGEAGAHGHVVVAACQIGRAYRGQDQRGARAVATWQEYSGRRGGS